LQRIGLSSHSAGMRNTLWQVGHFAWTTAVMAGALPPTRLLLSSDAIVGHGVPPWKEK
jgi:hypothetical protein